MSNYYAQIDDNGFLIGVSLLSNTVNNPNLIYIDQNDFNTLVGKFHKAKLVSGAWVEGATQEEINAILNPPPSEIEQMKTDLATMQETINFLLGL